MVWDIYLVLYIANTMVAICSKNQAVERHAIWYLPSSYGIIHFQHQGFQDNWDCNCSFKFMVVTNGVVVTKPRNFFRILLNTLLKLQPSDTLQTQVSPKKSNLNKMCFTLLQSLLMESTTIYLCIYIYIYINILSHQFLNHKFFTREWWLITRNQFQLQDCNPWPHYLSSSHYSYSHYQVWGAIWSPLISNIPPSK